MLTPNLMIVKSTAKTMPAIQKSKKQANMEASGSTAFGKYILVTKLLLPTKLWTENFKELIKKVQGKTLTDIETTPSMSIY